jgi:hypothetical protein
VDIGSSILQFILVVEIRTVTAAVDKIYQLQIKLKAPVRVEFLNPVCPERCMYHVGMLVLVSGDPIETKQ